MSDRICIMRDGQIVQTGSPRDLSDRPGGRDVADFVGTSNFFAGHVESRAGKIAKLVGPGGPGFVGLVGDGLPSANSV